MAANNIIISINTKMTIKMFARNNRIIIKESFATVILLVSYEACEQDVRKISMKEKIRCLD